MVEEEERKTEVCRVPRLLENPGKYLIFSPKISRPWKVLEIKV